MRSPITRAGIPPTMVNGATSFVTTAPAATTAPSPIVTPGRIVDRLATYARSPITTGPPVAPKPGS